MTPLEHYRRAEALLVEAERPEPELAASTRSFLAAAAQVHATLAAIPQVAEYRQVVHPTRPLPPPVLDGHGRDTLQETP